MLHLILNFFKFLPQKIAPGLLQFLSGRLAYIVVNILLGGLVFLMLYNYSLNKKIDSLNKDLTIYKLQMSLSDDELKNCHLEIEGQNEKFKSLQVDNKRLKQAKEKAEARFKSLAVPDNNCESKLKFYEGLFQR